MPAWDIFSEPVGTTPPPSMMERKEDHPVPRAGILTDGPIETNKFYSNFFLGDQTGPTYTFPYSISWMGGKGVAPSWGIACSHVEARQRVFGKESSYGAASYYINPIGIQSMTLSAKELGSHTVLSIDSMTAFSARVLLSPNNTAEPVVSFPLVQGMPYLTAQYSNAYPVIQSGVFWNQVTNTTRPIKKNVKRWNFTLNDGTVWRLYAYHTKGDPLELNVTSEGHAVAMQPFTGIIQIAKDPITAGSLMMLNDGAGIYPVTVALSGTTSGHQGEYRFDFQKEGHDTGNLYMFALPHHIESFDAETRSRIGESQLQTPTKGVANLVRGSHWTMAESNLPTGMDFAPWSPERGSIKKLSGRAKSLIQAAAASELSQNMIAQTDLDSMYFSGKVS